MRTGRFPSQEEALRRRLQELVDERVQQASGRRAFMALGGGGLLGTLVGATSYALAFGGETSGERVDARPAAEPQPRVTPTPLDAEHQRGIKLANGPLDLLLAEGHLFLGIVIRFPDSAALWQGVHRLAFAAPHVPGDRGHRLVYHTALVLRKPGAPPHLKAAREHLEIMLKRPR